MKERIAKFLEKAVYWSLAIFPFTMALSPAFTGAFTGILFSSYLAKKMLKKEAFLTKTSIDTPFLFWVAVSLVSIVHSINYEASIRGVFRLTQYALLYLILVEEIRDRQHLKKVAFWLILGAVLVSLDAFWQVTTGKDFIRGFQPLLNIGLVRATAAFPNPNVMGVYLSAIVPVLLGLTFFYLRGKKKSIALSLSVLVSGGVILSFSRGTGLAFFFALLLMNLVRKKKAIVILLLLLFLAFPLIMPAQIKGWAKKVNYNPVLFLLNPDRISIFKNSANMIAHHPFIGVGLNTFSKNYLQYKLPEIGEEYKTGDSMYAHNNFLHMAGEIGLLGLAAFFWLLIVLFRESIRIYKGLKDNLCKIMAMSLTAGIVAFLINGMTETSLYYTRVSVIFWYLIGVLLALKKFTHAAVK